MQKPLISIIIPVYNAEKYLVKCLDSVVNQTYRNLEIILVDDGSTDKSPEICEEYAKKDNRIKLLHKENGGVSSARNAGLSMISGEYIAWVDSDDYVETDYIEYMYKLLAEHDADISSCKRLLFKCSLKDEVEQNTNLSKSNNILANQSLKEKREPLVVNSKNDIMRIHVTLLEENILISNTFYCKLIKKELFNNITVDGAPFDDAATMYKVIAKCNKYIIGEEIKYYYRFLETSISHKFDIKLLNRINARIKQKEFLKNNFPELYDYSCRDIIYYSNITIRKIITSNSNPSFFLNSTFEDVKAKTFLKKQYKENLFKYLKYIKGPITDKILAVLAYISVPLTIRIYRAKFHNNFWIIKIKKLLGII
jgi:glycosyltransferase involved in cell wall biosynthesis